MLKDVSFFSLDCTARFGTCTASERSAADSSFYGSRSNFEEMVWKVEIGVSSTAEEVVAITACGRLGRR